MSENHDEMPKEQEPSYAKHLSMAVETMTGRIVDISWLADWDMNRVEALRSALLYESFRMQGKKMERYENEGDFLLHIDAISSSIADVFDSARHGCSDDTPLFALLLMLAEHAFDYGVATAYEHKLSDEYMRKTAGRIERIKEKEKLMAEFCNDIRDL